MPKPLPLDRERPVGPERRFAPPDLRAEGESSAPRIVGHASVFNQWTTLYEDDDFLWREMVRPGAFARAIRDKQDVRALFNHDDNFVLGRTAAGTLRLSEDASGLLTEIDPPDTQLGRDLVVSIGRGDISGMSIGFYIPTGPEVIRSDKAGVTVLESGGEKVTVWREGAKLIEEREVLDADLFDVSPVTNPAFPQTDVGIRSAGLRHAHQARSLAARLIGTPRRNRAERLLRLTLAGLD